MRVSAFVNELISVSHDLGWEGESVTSSRSRIHMRREQTDLLTLTARTLVILGLHGVSFVCKKFTNTVAGESMHNYIQRVQKDLVLSETLMNSDCTG